MASSLTYQEKSVKLSKDHIRDFHGNFQISLKVGSTDPSLLALFDILAPFNY